MASAPGADVAGLLASHLWLSTDWHRFQIARELSIVFPGIFADNLASTPVVLMVGGGAKDELRAWSHEGEDAICFQRYHAELAHRLAPFQPLMDMLGRRWQEMHTESHLCEKRRWEEAKHAIAAGHSPQRARDTAAVGQRQRVRQYRMGLLCAMLGLTPVLGQRSFARVYLEACRLRLQTELDRLAMFEACLGA